MRVVTEIGALPAGAPAGTVVSICVAVADRTTAAVVPNVTVLPPASGSKFCPYTVTSVPTRPAGGETDVMTGAPSVGANVAEKAAGRPDVSKYARNPTALL